MKVKYNKIIILIIITILFAIVQYVRFNEPTSLRSWISIDSLPFEMPIREITDGMQVRQTFTVDDDVIGFSILLATNARINSEYVHIEMRINQKKVFESTIPCSSIDDNSHKYFNLDRRHPVQKHSTGEIIVTSIGGEPGNAITIWASLAESRNNEVLFIDGNQSNANLCFQIISAANPFHTYSNIASLILIACIIFILFIKKFVIVKEYILYIILVVISTVGFINFILPRAADGYDINNLRYDIVYTLLNVSLLIVLSWILASKYGFIEKAFNNISNILNAAKEKETQKKVLIEALWLIFIFAISLVIEIIVSLIAEGDRSFNKHRWYLCLAVGLSLYCIIKFRGKPEKIFILVSLIIGLLYAVTLPLQPVSTWDELIHYNKAVDFSSTDIVAVNDFEGRFGFGYGFKFSSSERKELISNLNEEYISGSFIFDKQDYTHLYSYLGYIPASIMFFIAKLLFLPFSTAFVLGRFGIHIAYTLIIYFAMKKLKSGKYILAVIALFPTAFFQSVNYTLDYWVTAWIMLGFAYFFHEIQNPKSKADVKNLIIMVGAFIIAMGGKPVYFLFMIPLYFLGKYKFNTKTARNGYFIGLSVSIMFILGTIILPFFLSGGDVYSDFRGGSDISAPEQIRYILNNPVTYARNLLTFLLTNYLNFNHVGGYTSFFAYLGSISHSFLVWMVFALAFLTDKNEWDIHSSSIKYRLLLWGSTFATISLIATSMYIAFTPVGAGGFAGVQPRYLIPVLFPLFYVLGSSKIVNNINKNAYSVFIYGIMSYFLLSGIWQTVIVHY